jgi:hypothetical protein
MSPGPSNSTRWSSRNAAQARRPETGSAHSSSASPRGSRRDPNSLAARFAFARTCGTLAARCRMSLFRYRLLPPPAQPSQPPRAPSRCPRRSTRSPVYQRAPTGGLRRLAREDLRPKLPQQKTPRRGAGALLGLLQGGEICISIYVDPWEVGEPCCVVGARCGKHLGPYLRRGTRPRSSLFCFLSVAPTESLNSVRTYVLNVCEWGHRAPLWGRFSCSWAEFNFGQVIRRPSLYTRARGPASPGR